MRALTWHGKRDVRVESVADPSIESPTACRTAAASSSSALGPIGDMSARVAQHRGYRVIGVDLVPERLDRARARWIEVLDLREHDELPELIRAMTGGRGPDSVIDAVGMEAHGAPVAKAMQTVTGFLPNQLSAKLAEKAGVDRLHALYLAIDIVRRGGTISLGRSPP